MSLAELSDYLAGIDALVAVEAQAQAAAPSVVGDAVSDVFINSGPALVPFFSPGTSPPIVPGAVPAEKKTPALKSELPGVSNEAWTKFVLAMMVAQPNAVSASNELGAFAMKIRRLIDLGLMTQGRQKKSATGRMVWTAEFLPPLTQKLFLGSPKIQYRAFAASMRRYADALKGAKLPTDGTTFSGVLAILHRCGPAGLKAWSDPAKRFSDTELLVERTNKIF